MLAKTKGIFFLSTLYSLLSTFLIGCATAASLTPPLSKEMPGVYHKVKDGQTLWRIAKSYGVEMEKIARFNRLTDTSRIDTGQIIFVPEASTTLEDLTLETDFKDKGGDFIWPAKGRVSSFYGMCKNAVKNKGICIQTKEDASVLAARSGRVAFCSQQLRDYEKIIIIDHLDGYSTVYAQNLKILVKFNQLVKQGQIIAKADGPGSVVKPELYFEIRKGHRPENPFFYLP